MPSSFLAQPFKKRTCVIAAVKVVLPWSTCPIVPTFTCGFVRSNLAFSAISFTDFNYNDNTTEYTRKPVRVSSGVGGDKKIPDFIGDLGLLQPEGKLFG